MRWASPGGHKSVAKRPERNQGGRREEIYRPALASGMEPAASQQKTGLALTRWSFERA